MKTFVQGQRAKLSDLTPSTSITVGVHVALPTPDGVDVCCFGVDDNSQLSDDRYLIFYNQRSSPCGSLVATGTNDGDSERFHVNLLGLPQTIRRLVFTATLDGMSVMSHLLQGHIRMHADGANIATYQFTGTDFDQEKSLIIGELYFKDAWRFRAVGQGFAGGLSALLKHFGGEEQELESDKPIEECAPKANGDGKGKAKEKATTDETCVEGHDSNDSSLILNNGL